MSAQAKLPPSFLIHPLTASERRSMRALQRKWATQRADAADIHRCRELERRDAIARAWRQP